MRVVPPVSITESMIVASNLAEPGPGEVQYNVGTTYAVDAVVIDTATHKSYTSLQSGNVGKPLPVYPNTKTDWWIVTGATNRHSLFDLTRNSKSVSTGSTLTMSFTPGVRINTIAVLGLEADSITIDYLVSAVVVKTLTKNLIYRRLNDGYDYAFSPFARYPSVVMLDVPPFTNGTVSITITANTGVVKCGSIVVGTAVFIGNTQKDAESDSQNFSTVTRDVLGNATLVARRTVPKNTYVTEIEPSRIGTLLDLRVALNAVPALWMGLDDADSNFFEPLLILGVYNRFKISMKETSSAFVSLELEEI